MSRSGNARTASGPKHIPVVWGSSWISPHYRPSLLLALSGMLLLAYFDPPVAVHAQRVGMPYFHMSEGTEKCFFRDAPADVPIAVSYHHHNNPGIDCAIHFKDPAGRIVFNRGVTKDEPEGKVSYLVKTAGEYKVCILCPSTQWYSATLLSWSFSVDISHGDIDLENMAKTHHVEDAEAVLKSLEERFQILSAENDYERHQEEAFRALYNNASLRIMLFAILEMGVLSVVTAFSIYHLSLYFRAQKLF